MSTNKHKIKRDVIFFREQGDEGWTENNYLIPVSEIKQVLGFENLDELKEFIKFRDDIDHNTPIRSNDLENKEAKREALKKYKSDTKLYLSKLHKMQEDDKLSSLADYTLYKDGVFIDDSDNVVLIWILYPPDY